MAHEKPENQQNYVYNKTNYLLHRLIKGYISKNKTKQKSIITFYFARKGKAVLL